jgi:hypothetical protein
VRVLPVAASPFALLDDLVNGGLRGGQIGDGDHLRPAEPFRRRLSAWRADEQRPFTEPIGERGQSALDAAVEVADSRELLPVRHRLAGIERFERRSRRDEALGVLAFHAFRPFQIKEVQQRLLAERQQVQLHAGRKVP